MFKNGTGWFRPRMVGFIHPACYASIVNKANNRNMNEKNVHRLFLICMNIMSFIYSDVKVVIHVQP